jgi:hypothetical protein
MPSPRQLHLEAMDVMDAALADERDVQRTLDLLQKALQLEMAAADYLAADYASEPTRSLLFRGASSIALRVQDVPTAKRYAEAGLAGKAPGELKDELNGLYEQILTLEALMHDYRRRAPVGLTRIQRINRRFRETAPVDIYGLADALGLAVQIIDLKPTIFGIIFRDVYRGGFSGFTVHVNARHSRPEQRLTIAHEIAHLQRHRDRVGNRLIDDRMHRSQRTDTKEREAQELGSQLLIPGVLMARFQNAGITTAEGLAEKFDVPLELMRKRMGAK